MTRIVITVFQVKKNAFLATNFLLIYDERAELKKATNGQQSSEGSVTHK